MQNYRPFTGITPAVKILLILNIVMYFLSMFIDSRMHVDTAHLLGLHLPQSVFWRPWQYVTHMFMHGSFIFFVTGSVRVSIFTIIIISLPGMTLLLLLFVETVQAFFSHAVRIFYICRGISAFFYRFWSVS